MAAVFSDAEGDDGMMSDTPVTTVLHANRKSPMAFEPNTNVARYAIPLTMVRMVMVICAVCSSPHPHTRPSALSV